MKYSTQREAIYHAVLNSGSHPTADRVYASLKKDIPNLSLATVYRNLALLCAAGKLQKVSVPGGADHFDATMRMHAHAVCEKCGRVFDVEVNIPELVARIEQESGLTITSAQLHFTAVCPQCTHGASPDVQ